MVDEAAQRPVNRSLKRIRSVALILALVVALLATFVRAAPTLLVWNASASAPVGLYGVRPGARIRRGDMAVAWAPGPARRLASARRYLPSNVPLVKRVAAVGGDQVCAFGGEIRINGRRAASRFKRDLSGRPMPWWRGCHTLGAGEVFLLNAESGSFDGRYFGVTKRDGLVGRARLLWAR